MSSTFNPDQLAMAIYLTACAIVNAWFVRTSRKRIIDIGNKDDGVDEKKHNVGWNQQKLLSFAVLAMALFDIPWIWFCMIQCWNNAFGTGNGFDQGNETSSFGCKFMGW